MRARSHDPDVRFRVDEFRQLMGATNGPPYPPRSAPWRSRGASRVLESHAGPGGGDAVSPLCHRAVFWRCYSLPPRSSFSWQDTQVATSGIALRRAGAMGLSHSMQVP